RQQVTTLERACTIDETFCALALCGKKQTANTALSQLAVHGIDRHRTHPASEFICLADPVNVRYQPTENQLHDVVVLVVCSEQSPNQAVTFGGKAIVEQRDIALAIRVQTFEQ